MTVKLSVRRLTNPAAALAGPELFEITQGGATVVCTAEEIKDYVFTFLGTAATLDIEDLPGGAPDDADYLVKTANGGLSAERAVTDSATVIADWSVSGQVSFSVVGGGTSPTVPTDWKDSVLVASTANLTLSGEQTIDGVLTSASRVLAKDQTTGADRGIYVTAAGAWTRATDADGAGELSTGTLVFVESGTANGNQLFALTTSGTITIGTTPQTWQSVSIPANFFTGKTVSGTTYTHILSDGGKRLNLTNAGTKLLTVAPQSSVSSPVNTEIEVYNAGAGLATLAGGSGVTVNGTLTLAQYSLGKLKKRANPNTWDFTTGSAASSSVGTATGWLNVKDAAYGALGDGTTDDTAAINAAIAAVNSAGSGVIFFPPGTYKTTAALTSLTCEARLLGSGCADNRGANAITTISCTSATANLLTFTASGGKIEHIHFENTAVSTPTAGSALFLDNGEGTRIIDCTFDRWWIGVDFEDGREWFATRCMFYAPIKYGMRMRHVAIPDGGDQHVTDCHFIAKTHAADAAIYCASGGGVKMMGLKINVESGGFTNGILIDAVTATQTILFQLSNSSIENCTGVPFKAVSTGSGLWEYIMLSNVQTGQYGGANQYAVEISAASIGKLDRLVIDGCNFGGNVGASLAAIRLVNVNNAAIGPCVYKNHPTLLSLSGCTNIRNSNRDYVVTLTDGTNIATDAILADSFRVTLAGNRTLDNPTNIHNGQALNWRIIQDGAGSRTLSYGSIFKWAGGGAPALSTAAGSKDLLCCQYDAADNTLNCVLSKAFS